MPRGNQVTARIKQGSKMLDTNQLIAVPPSNPWIKDHASFKNTFKS